MEKPQLPEFSRRLGLFTALASIVLAAPALAQSVWTGNADNEFSNGSNWVPGPPGPDDAATVNTGSPQVTNNFVITEMDVNGGNVTVTNTGELTVTGGSTVNSGSLSINAGGVLNSDVELNGGGLSIDGDLNGRLTLNGGGVSVDGTLGSAAIGNTTSLTNNGRVGGVDVSAGGTFVNNSGATAGAVTNAGTASNAGTITSLTNTAGNFTNNTGGVISGNTIVAGGSVTNNFVITAADVAAGAAFTNNTGASAGAVRNSGTVSNAGAIASLQNNAGSFTNNFGGRVTGQTAVAGGSVTNNAALGSVGVGTAGTFTNASGATAGAVTNSGTTSNAGTIASLRNDAGSFTNNAGGRVTGTTNVSGGTVTNNFVITAADIAAGAVLVNNSGATAGAVTNAGSTSNAGTVASLQNTGGTFTNNGGGTVTGTTTVSGGNVVNNATVADVDIGAGGSFTNNGGAVAGTVANAGTGSNDGTVASLTNSAGTFSNTGRISGSAAVTGGSLVNDGTVVGAIDVFDGGLLTGSGDMGALTVNSGGVLAPGPGIQVVAVNGNLTFRSGSIYRVDIDATGLSDRVDAAGALAIEGGTLEILAGSGLFGLQTDYTILTASSVTGAFDAVTSDFAFLSPILTYVPTRVELGLYRNDVAFADVALTDNGRSTANAVEALGSTNALFLAVLPLDVPTAGDAFSQLSGEAHASLNSQLLWDSRYPREAIFDRMNPASETRLQEVEGATFWTSGYVATSRLSSDGNAAGIDGDTAGVIVGADAAVSDQWRLGGVLGYSHAEAGSQAEAASYHVGLYATGDFGPLDIAGGAIYSRNDASTDRGISFGSISDRLRADYDSATTQFFADLSWTMEADAIVLQPFANIAYVNIETDGFHESGGAAALSAASGSDDVTMATFGLRWSADLPVDEWPVAVSGMLGWRHAFGDLSPSTRLAFAGGSPFLIEGVTMPRDALVVEAGVSAKLSKSARLNLTYAGEFGDGATFHAARANLTVNF